MRIDRSLLNWGVFLIAIGGIPLAVDQGWLESDIAADLGRLWPLILVGIGLGLILRWTPLAWFGGALVAATFGIILGAAVVAIPDDDIANLQGIIPAIAAGTCANGDVGTASTRESGVGEADAFELDVNLSCGELDVARAVANTWSLEAKHDTGDAPSVEASDPEGTSARLRLSQGGSDDLGFLGRQVRSLWTVQVPATAALTVHATLNAARGKIDAGSGPVARLAGTFNAADTVVDLASVTTPSPASIELTFNASSGRLSLPNGDITADITLNASSLVVCVPSSAALGVDYSTVLGSDDLGSSGLTDQGAGQWSSSGYEAAQERVSLSVTSTVSSLTIERPEACS